MIPDFARKTFLLDLLAGGASSLIDDPFYTKLVCRGEGGGGGGASASGEDPGSLTSPSSLTALTGAVMSALECVPER
jgi:hypothetical protein